MFRYTFDLKKCMFSSGNITEKIRMSKLQCHDEVVVDMFAGMQNHKLNQTYKFL